MRRQQLLGAEFNRQIGDQPQEAFEPANRLRGVLELTYWGLLVIGLLLLSPALIVLGSGWLVVAYFPRYYATWGQQALHYRARFAQAFAWPGDSVELTIEVENRSFLPISLLRVWDDVSAHFNIAGAPPTSGTRKQQLEHAFRLGMWQRVRRRYIVPCERRGLLSLGPTSIEVTGPFGYGTAERRFTDLTQVAVYPRVHALETLRTSPLALLGPSTLRSFLHEDPLRIRGVREYIPGDPLSRINWKASAKTARHMVHVHEPSANVNVLLLLNLSTSDDVWFDQDISEIEWAIEVAASLGVALLDADCSVGVFANDYVTDVPVGADVEHMHSLLVALANTPQFAQWRPSAFLASAMERRRFGMTLVLVTPVLTLELLSALEAARGRRAPLRIVYTGTSPSPLFDDTTMLWVQREECGYVQ